MLWKPIPGFTRYEISEHGDVRRSLSCPRTGQGIWRKPGELLKIDLSAIYASIRLMGDDGKLRTKRIHVLMAWAFHEAPPKGKPNALHKDDVKRNNYYKNIYWGTQSQNIQDAIENGGIKIGYKRSTPWQHGENGPNAKLTNKEAAEIRLLWIYGSEVSDLVVRFGVCSRTIRNVIKRKIYKNGANQNSSGVD